MTGETISKPTTIKADPYACGGMAPTNGEKKSVPTKQSAVTTAVRPVRPPASTPVADSMNAPEVVVPTMEAKMIESASAAMGRSICGRFPFSSRNPARAETPINVPIVSTKAMMKIVRTTGKKPQVRTPEKSSLRKIGESEGGMLTQALGAGATPNR